MEFKTEGYWVSAESSGNANPYIYIALVLWVLACSHQDSILLVTLRIVLLASARFLKACAAAITPRRRRRRQRD